jgi:hypothetical protein
MLWQFQQLIMKPVDTIGVSNCKIFQMTIKEIKTKNWSTHLSRMVVNKETSKSREKLEIITNLRNSPDSIQTTTHRMARSWRRPLNTVHKITSEVEWNEILVHILQRSYNSQVSRRHRRICWGCISGPDATLWRQLTKHYVRGKWHWRESIYSHTITTQGRMS